MVTHLPCPVCGESTPVSVLEEARHLRAVQEWLRLYDRSEYWKQLAPAGTLQWACPTCLETGRALKAALDKQVFCDHPPYLAYYDVTMDPCTDCGQPYVFGASEQRFWYEELQFMVQSRPKQCAPCRKQRRERNLAQQQLGEATRTLDPRDPDQLATVAELLYQAGAHRKGREYAARARNLVRRLGNREDLVERMTSLIAQPDP